VDDYDRGFFLGGERILGNSALHRRARRILRGGSIDSLYQKGRKKLGATWEITSYKEQRKNKFTEGGKSIIIDGWGPYREMRKPERPRELSLAEAEKEYRNVSLFRNGEDR